MASLKPSERLVMNISKEIGLPLDYKDLATGLGVPAHTVDNIKAQTTDSREIAFEVLKIWRLKEDASGQVLYDVLREGGEHLKALASKYERELLGTDYTSAEKLDDIVTEPSSQASATPLPSYSPHNSKTKTTVQVDETVKASPKSSVSASSGTHRIDSNLAVLLKRLDAAAILDDLLYCDIIDAKEYWELDEMTQKTGGQQAATKCLVRKLRSKNESKIDSFIECLRGYSQFVALVRKMEGVSPTQTDTLYVPHATTTLSTHCPKVGLPSQKPAAAAQRMHGVVPPGTPHFCGRELIISDVVEQVLSNNSDRVISLVGPPGFGKTSIAVAVSHRLIQESKAQVFFVRLQGVQDGSQAISQVVSALSCLSRDETVLANSSPCSVLSASVASLKGCCVIVLDNAEDVLDLSKQTDTVPSPSFFEIVKTITESNDSVKVLITSRVTFDALAINTREHRIGGLSKKHAMDLLTSLSPNVNDKAAAQIACCCGYVPLALRITVGILRRAKLTPEELIADFKEVGLNALKASGTWLQPEEQLVRMLEVSIKRLSKKLQLAFHGLALFPSSFSAEAATAVIGLKSVIRFKREVAEELHDRCLLEHDEVLHRYSMHPLLSQFGRQASSKSDSQLLKCKFSLFYLQRFQHYSQCIAQPRGEEDLWEFLMVEYYNFSQAVIFLPVLTDEDMKFLRHLLDDVDMASLFLTFPPPVLLPLFQKWARINQMSGNVTQQRLSHLYTLTCSLLSCQWQQVLEAARAIRQLPLTDMEPTEQAYITHFASSMVGLAEFALRGWTDMEAFHSHLCCVGDCMFTNAPQPDDIGSILMESLALLYSGKSMYKGRMVVAIKSALQWVENVCRTSTLTENQKHGLVHLCKTVSSIWIVWLSVPKTPFNQSQAEQAPFTASDLLVIHATLRSLQQNDLLEASFSLAERTKHSKQMSESLYQQSQESWPIVLASRANYTVRNIASIRGFIALGVPGSIIPICTKSHSAFYSPDTTTVIEHIRRDAAAHPESGLIFEKKVNQLSELEQVFTALVFLDLRLDISGTQQVKAFINKYLLAEDRQRRHLTISITSVPFLAGSAMEYATLKWISHLNDNMNLSAPELSRLLQGYVKVECCTNCLAMQSGQSSKSPGALLHPCLSCGVVFYCSSACKNAHRKQHKMDCAKLNTARRHAAV